MKWLSKKDAARLLEIAELVGKAQTLREVRYYKKEVYKILQSAKTRNEHRKAMSTT